MEPIHIYRAGLQHLDELVPLFDAYRQFYQQTSNLEGARAFLAARIGNEESVVFLAGRTAGNPEGLPNYIHCTLLFGCGESGC